MTAEVARFDHVRCLGGKASERAKSTFIHIRIRTPARPTPTLVTVLVREKQADARKRFVLDPTTQRLATNAYDSGVPMEQIQEMLADASMIMTRRYTKISARRVSASYDVVEDTIFTKKPRGGRND